MAEGAVLRCSGCGKSWTVAPREDGSFPQIARCPVQQGGCGKARRIPAAARATATWSPSAGGWNPPSEPRGFREIDGGTCSDCQAAVEISPRGAALWCSGCGSAVTPPGVAAPYARGGPSARKVKSQRETDLEAIDLAGRKGVMLGQLRALAEGDRLDDASRLKVEWFADEVRAARTGGRLDSLAELWAEAGIRPRRWWQTQPAALDAGDYDDDVDDEDERQGDGPAALILPAPVVGTAPQPLRAQPRRMAWHEAVAACGYRTAPNVDALCQIIDDGLRCGYEGTRHIGRDFPVGDVFVCARHADTLVAAIRIYTQRTGT